jgi:dihydrolipoamide dehydrogenase
VKKGVRIFTGAKVTTIIAADQAVCQFEQSGKVQTVASELVIVAIGRKPRSQNIGLENVGIVTQKDLIPVNDLMETEISGIYAIGDVTGKCMLAHVASEQGVVAAENAAGGHQQMNYSNIPSCIYTTPEIAVVGLSETEAKRKGILVKVGRFPVAANSKAMIAGERDGFAKIVTDAQTGEVLGAQIIAPKATELISGIGIAMTLESTADEIAKTIHPHPTLSEMIMEAALDVSFSSIHQPKKPNHSRT